MSLPATPSDLPAAGPECISFLLVPDFSMMAFVSAVEPLRVANRLAGRQIFAWQILSLDGAPVTASNGMTVVADTSFDAVQHLPMLFICSRFEPERFTDNRPLYSWLRRMAAYNTILGAIDTGCYLLARDRLLSGYRVTLHWESVTAFTEA